MFHSHSVRRVVTGHDANGKAVVASDEWVDPVTSAVMPGSEFHQLWGGDAAPSFPDDGRPSGHHDRTSRPSAASASASSPCRR